MITNANNAWKGLRRFMLVGFFRNKWISFIITINTNNLKTNLLMTPNQFLKSCLKWIKKLNLFLEIHSEYVILWNFNLHMSNQATHEWWIHCVSKIVVLWGIWLLLLDITDGTTTNKLSWDYFSATTLFKIVRRDNVSHNVTVALHVKNS